MTDTTTPDMIPWDTSRPNAAPESKEVRSPVEAVSLAQRNPGQAILYSTGQTKGSARLRAKKIKRGEPKIWATWQGRLLAGAYPEEDGTHSVRVCWPEGVETD